MIRAPGLAGELPVITRHFEVGEFGSGRGQSQSQLLILRREVLGRSSDKPARLSLLPFAPPGKSVRKHCPESRILQGLNHRVGVRGRVLDMRPVKEGRDAGVYGAEGRDKVADVGVLGPKGRSQLVQNARESELPVLEDETAGQRRADALTSICLDSLTGPNPAGETGRAVTVAEIFIEAAWALSSNGEAGAALSTGVKVGPNTLGEILCGGKVRVTNCAPTHPLSYSDLGDTIPPAVRRYVKWRDQGSCSIEGCTSRYRVHPSPHP